MCRGWLADGALELADASRKNRAYRLSADLARLVRLVESVIGPGVSVLFSQVFFKAPEGGGPKPAHQDNWYFGPRDPEALTLADQALNAEPNYVLDEYQSTQLWGPKLRAASQRLFREPRLRTTVERAHANANPDGDSGEEEEF